MTDVIKHPNLVKCFCKHYNLPINVYHGIYFAERLQVLDRIYGCIDMFNTFQKDLEKFDSEEQYFEYVSNISKEIIQNIESKPSFVRLMSDESMIDSINHNDDSITLAQIRSQYKNIELYTGENDGYNFVSIDMNKANFSSLRCFSGSIFDSKTSWDRFVGEFTDVRHLQNSRYFRQYIFGECCPKILPKIERYIMGNILNKIVSVLPEWKQYVYSLNNDEILFKIPDIDLKTISIMVKSFDPIFKTVVGGDAVRVKCFKLCKVHGTTGYMKHYHDGNVEYKCFDQTTLIQVIRYWDNEPISPIDLTFVHNGRLARYEEPIENPWKEKSDAETEQRC